MLKRLSTNPVCFTAQEDKTKKVDMIKIFNLELNAAFNLKILPNKRKNALVLLVILFIFLHIKNNLYLLGD